MPKELTKEETSMNNTAKFLAKALMDAKAWDWDKQDMDIETFAHYKPNASVQIVEYDYDNKKFSGTRALVSGAEYRHALTLVRAYGYYSDLSEDAQKLVNKELFGQETRPAESSPEFKAGLLKAYKKSHIIGGEILARRVVQAPGQEKPPVSVKMSSLPFTDAEMAIITTEIEKENALKSSSVKTTRDLSDTAKDAVSGMQHLISDADATAATALPRLPKSPFAVK